MRGAYVREALNQGGRGRGGVGSVNFIFPNRVQI